MYFTPLTSFSVFDCHRSAEFGFSTTLLIFGSHSALLTSAVCLIAKLIVKRAALGSRKTSVRLCAKRLRYEQRDHSVKKLIDRLDIQRYFCHEKMMMTSEASENTILFGSTLMPTEINRSRVAIQKPAWQTRQEWLLTFRVFLTWAATHIYGKESHQRNYFVESWQVSHATNHVSF